MAQLKAIKSPLLQSYVLSVNPEHTHIDTDHLFNCSQVPTQHHAKSVWKKALQAGELIEEWESRLAFLRS